MEGLRLGAGGLLGELSAAPEQSLHGQAPPPPPLPAATEPPRGCCDKERHAVAMQQDAHRHVPSLGRAQSLKSPPGPTAK